MSQDSTSPNISFEERALKAERLLEEARETNRKLHRRVQEAESGVFREKLVRNYFEIKNSLAHHTAQSSFTFERLTRSHATMKRIYEAAAKVLDLPYGSYHSVMDWAFTDQLYRFKPTSLEPGSVYANVYLTKMGGVVSYEIAEVVEEAFAVLRDQMARHAAE